MKKLKNVTAFYKKDLIKRFFIIDFNLQSFFVKEERITENVTLISFNDLLSVDFCTLEKNNKSKTFSKPFLVKLKGRDYELYAGSNIERELWMAAFDYAIKSTKVVQKII